MNDRGEKNIESPYLFFMVRSVFRLKFMYRAWPSELHFDASYRSVGDRLRTIHA